MQVPARRHRASAVLSFAALAPLFFCAPASGAQQPSPSAPPARFVVLDYMKVAPGKNDEYLRLEREVFKPFHQQRIKDKRLLGWELYEVRYTADTKREYDYVTANAYESMAATDDQSGLVERFQRMYPGQQGTRILTQTGAARQTVRTEVWRLVDQIVPGKTPPGKYLVVDYMKSKNDDYVKVERELWKPIHQDRARSGALDDWSLWSLQLPGGTSYPYDYATVNRVSSLGALDTPYPDDLFKRVHPNIPLADLGSRTGASRDLTPSELWVLVDRTP